MRHHGKRSADLRIGVNGRFPANLAESEFGAPSQCPGTLRQLQIRNSKSLVAPGCFDVGDAAFDRFNGQCRIEFKDLDVARFHEWLECGEVNRAGAGRGMIVRGKLHVVNVKSGQARGERFEMLCVVKEAEVFLDCAWPVSCQ